jgi:hypothetical protein
VNEKRKTILHDFLKIANTIRMISLETNVNAEELKMKLLILSQHLDKLYEDIKGLIENDTDKKQ